MTRARAHIFAGSRMRLPALLLAAALAAVGCSREEDHSELPESGAVFWEIPDPPQGVEFEVDGRAVDPELLRGYLLPLWAERWDDALSMERNSAEFFADPRSLFEPLARGVALIQEAERRWPELDEAELQAFDAEMRRAAGAAHDALLRRVGEPGLRAHQEREIRKRRLLDAFAASSEPVSDDEVFARYEAMLRAVDQPELLLERGVDFAAMAPLIRDDLERTRAVEAQEAWLDGRMQQVRARVRLPDGRSVSW